MNDVKVCGKRGFVTFCPACRDWEPFATGNPDGAWCQTCGGRLPEVMSYRSRCLHKVPEVLVSAVPGVVSTAVHWPCRLDLGHEGDCEPLKGGLRGPE